LADEEREAANAAALAERASEQRYLDNRREGFRQ